MTTAREAAIDRIATVLSGINGSAGGYYYTVAAVGRRAEGGQQFQSNQRPAIEIVPGFEWEYDEEPFRSDIVREAMFLVAYINPAATTDTAENLAVSRFRSDIRRALMADVTLNGTVRRLRMGKGRSTEAQKERDSRGVKASFEQQIIIEYEESEGP